jgi:type IV secretory pathway VirB4 component
MANSKATQEFVDIEEIRDGTIIMKDKSLRAVILCSSINFALKSEENQMAIISQFQNFLNAIDFSVQIFVQSRRLDIRPYLALLEERMKRQTSDLMKIQVREYIGFVKDFAENVNIMTKHFFVVVPFGGGPIDLQKGALQTLSTFLPNKKDNEIKTKEQTDQENFEERKMQLQQRVAVVEQSLVRLGIRTVRLGSDEIVELFYKIYNPGEQDKAVIPQTS